MVKGFNCFVLKSLSSFQHNTQKFFWWTWDIIMNFWIKNAALPVANIVFIVTFQFLCQLQEDFRSALFNLALLLNNDLKRPLEAVSYLETLLKVCPLSDLTLYSTGFIIIANVDALYNPNSSVLMTDIQVNIQCKSYLQ